MILREYLVIGCCLIPLEICGVKHNSRGITYGIGCVWGMPSLSPYPLLFELNSIVRPIKRPDRLFWNKEIWKILIKKFDKHLYPVLNLHDIRYLKKNIREFCMTIPFD